MTHAEAAAWLEDAYFFARQDSRHEDLAQDKRGPAELAEWERIVRLLSKTGGIYDPAADAAVQDERAADVAAAARHEAAAREAQRVTTRADELQALRDRGTLEQTEPREGDEAVRDELTRRGGGYAPGRRRRMARAALAAHLGHYRDPGAQEAAAGLLPPPLLAHAALPAELAHLAPGADIGQLAFAARVATTEPEAAGDLAAFLARARSRQTSLSALRNGGTAAGPVACNPGRPAPRTGSSGVAPGPRTPIPWTQTPVPRPWRPEERPTGPRRHRRPAAAAPRGRRSGPRVRRPHPGQRRPARRRLGRHRHQRPARPRAVHAVGGAARGPPHPPR